MSPAKERLDLGFPAVCLGEEYRLGRHMPNFVSDLDHGPICVTLPFLADAAGRVETNDCHG